MPGYICCICRNYNGLQRSLTLNGAYRTLCRDYDDRHKVISNGCPLTIGPEVLVCSNCHAGITAEDQKSLIGNLAGDRHRKGSCFVCKQAFVPVTAERDVRLFESLYGKAAA
jgi:hypothetical protein